MAEQKQEPIDLMIPPQNLDPFRTIEAVVVHIDPNKIAKQVYKQGWDEATKSELLALTATGLSILRAAAGIKAVPGGNYPIASEVKHPHVASYHCTLEWGGGTLMFEADYSLDLRDWIVVEGGDKIRGARFDETYHKFRSQQIIAASKGALPWNASTQAQEELFARMSEENQKTTEKVAEYLAAQDMRTQRIHMAAKVQTGAIDRALRKLLGLKSAYTLPELARGFRVYKMTDNFERIQKALGEDKMSALLLGVAQKQFGLTEGDLNTAARTLATMNQQARIAAPVEQAAPDPIFDVDEQAVVAALQSQVETEQPKTAEVVVEQPQAAVTTEGHVLSSNAQPLVEPKADPTAVPTVTGVKLPWRGELAFGDPLATLDPELDHRFVERATNLIKPKKHLEAHLLKHYKIKKWGSMTMEQAAHLWAYLDDQEFKE